MGRRRKTGNADWSTGGHRHHKLAILEEEKEALLKKKHKNSKSSKKTKDQMDTHDDNMNKQKPRTLEDSHPAHELNELSDLGVRGADVLSNLNLQRIFVPIYASVDSNQDPKVLITTARSPSGQTAQLASRVFTDFFPKSEFRDRKDFSVKEICREAQPLGYTHLVVIGQEKRKKKPDAMTIVLIGPTEESSCTAYFRLGNIKCDGKVIAGKGKSTPHFPELLLNHFGKTELGKAIGHLFVSLFPSRPQFTGRQVVTFHNQRDFIFVRRHRYVFEELPQGILEHYGDKDGLGRRTRLQELGPSFTMRLEGFQLGIYDPHYCIATSHSQSLSKPEGANEAVLADGVIPKAVILQAARFKNFLL